MRKTSADDPWVGALLVAHRYSVDITSVAVRTLGLRGNADIAALLAVHGRPDITPGELAALTGLRRPAASRSLRRLDENGLVQRRQASDDARSSLLRLSRRGRARVSRFQTTLTDYFTAGAPLAQDVIALCGEPSDPTGPAVTALEATMALSRAGAAYIAEASQRADVPGIGHGADRFALVLIRAWTAARPSAIGPELGLTISGTTDLLDRLASRGLVTRGHHDPTDRRAVVARLTADGERVVDALADVFARHSTAIATALALTLRVHDG